MRRLTAAVGVLFGVAGIYGSASAGTHAKPNAQKWLVLTSPGQPTRVIATGTVNAVGTVVDHLTLKPDGTFDNLATQNFPKGKLFYHGAGKFKITVDQPTCTGKGDVVGPFNITGGTGAYKGASGKGVALITLRFFFGKTSTGGSLRPTRTYGVAEATGTLIP
jgi:hypothetical protein